MKEELLLSIDLINSKLGYILACLSSYSSLDLSKRIDDINNKIYLIKKSIEEEKEYVDIRDVIKLRKILDEIKATLNEDKIVLKGHKIACLLFEVSTYIKLLIHNFDKSKEDLIEYLLLSSEFLYCCARVVNIEILCFEDKLI